VLNAADYLAGLEALSRDPRVKRSPRAARAWAEDRAVQLGLSDDERVEFVEASSSADESTVRDWLRRELVAPLVDVLPPDAQRALSGVPVGCLAVRVVNAASLRAPDGRPVVVVNQGLLAMLSFYIELLFDVGYLAGTRGERFATDHLYRNYAFIVSHFDAEGRVAFPRPLTKKSVEALTKATLMAMAAETFIVLHEFAHIVAGHLAVSRPAIFAPAATSTDVEVLRRSRRDEFEADEIAWDWYVRHSGAHPLLQPLRRDLRELAPLHFFTMLALLERNTSISLPLTHPPAVERMRRLAHRADGSLPAGFFVRNAESVPQLSLDFRKRALQELQAEIPDSGPPVRLQDEFKARERLLATVTEPELLLLMAMSLLNEADDLKERRRLDDAVAVYDELEERFRHEPMLHPFVLKAAFWKAHALCGRDRSEEAIAAFQDFLGRFADRDEIHRPWLAGSLLFMAVELRKLRRDDEALSAEVELVERFGEDPELYGLTLHASFNNGLRLSRLGRSEEAVAAYDRIIARFGTTPDARRVVGRARLAKALELRRQDHTDDALETTVELIAQLAADPDGERQLVREARELHRHLSSGSGSAGASAT
jgi:tetratricopeptide (TPR) repeat protein